MYGESYVNKLKNIPQFSDTISRRINNIYMDGQEQLDSELAGILFAIQQYRCMEISQMVFKPFLKM